MDTKVKAKAEAEQMAKKADAWKEFQEAAIVDMMLKVRKDTLYNFLETIFQLFQKNNCIIINQLKVLKLHIRRFFRP